MTSRLFSGAEGTQHEGTKTLAAQQLHREPPPFADEGPPPSNDAFNRPVSSSLSPAKARAKSSSAHDEKPVVVQPGADAGGHPQAEQSLPQSTFEIVESRDDATQTLHETPSCEDAALSGVKG